MVEYLKKTLQRKGTLEAAKMREEKRRGERRKEDDQKRIENNIDANTLIRLCIVYFSYML